MKVTRDWKLKDWLEASAYAVAILGTVAGAVVFLGGARSDAIEANRAALARAWTNEGDVLSNETKFIDVVLENYDGDIVGTLSSPRLDQTLDVSADIGWFSSTLTLTQLRGRAIVPVANVKVKIVGNNNRLSWQVTSLQLPDYLPRSTELWPHPQQQ